MSFKGLRVTVTGGAGFLGRAVMERLAARGCTEVFIPRRARYDLTESEAVERLFRDARPDVVLHLAAEVGGIGANMARPSDLYMDNLLMGTYVLDATLRAGTPKTVMIGTICAYPKFTPVPFREEELWNGYPEETNAPYGVAKKAAMVMLDGYRRQYGLHSAYVLPVNLYGPWDNFDLRSSHVIPALIRKCLEAQERGEASLPVWGTGSPSREFLYVDDAAEGILRAAEVMDEPVPINLGTTMEIRIRDLVELIARLTGFKGTIAWDPTKPDGQPRRCLDTQRAKALLGWQAQVGFEEGLRRTIEWYRSQRARS